ncbi:MAG: hypothetical protein MUE81_04775 [Thermoflexibacter sp.]|jgi:hypothetical protein|nr:hypothetical protein [Thermoflexibacter sp.]
MLIQDIAEDILEQKCLLVLGAGIATDAEGKLLRSIFYEQLFQKYHHNLPESERIITGYNAQDELFIFAKPYPDPDVVSEVRRFYNKDFAGEVFSQLAQLPLHLIINTMPDESLAKIWTEGQCFSAYFDKSKNDSEEINKFFLENKDKKGILNKPLIYNLLGSSQNEETLIITHRNMFDFIKEVLKEDRLPTSLMTAVNSVSRIVFLGVEFDKWYVQLILQLLTHKRTKGFKGYAEEQNLDRHTKTVYEKDFSINFVIEQIPAFVGDLFAYFKQHHPQKLKALHQSKLEKKEVEEVFFECQNTGNKKLRKSVGQAIGLKK